MENLWKERGNCRAETPIAAVVQHGSPFVLLTPTQSTQLALLSGNLNITPTYQTRAIFPRVQGADRMQNQCVAAEFDPLPGILVKPLNYHSTN